MSSLEPPTAPSAQSISWPTNTYQYGQVPTSPYQIPVSVFPNSPSAPAPPVSTSITSPNSGLWIGVGLVGGIALSGTKAAPLVFGILSVGLIYQLQQLLSGK